MTLQADEVQNQGGYIDYFFYENTPETLFSALVTFDIGANKWHDEIIYSFALNPNETFKEGRAEYMPENLVARAHKFLSEKL
jgi:hypothetical protein